MIKSYIKLGLMGVGTVLLLVGCGGDGDGDSADSTTGAPEDILGYKLDMTITEVEIVEYSPTANLLDVGDTMTLQFIDQNTIAGESKFREISHESWDYSASGNTAELNLYTAGGEVHFDFETDDRKTGTFVYDGEIYSTGVRTKYYGDLAISRIDGADENTNDDTNQSGFAAELQGKWENCDNYGYGDIYEFSGSQMRYSTAIYESDICSTEPMSTLAGTSADFTIGEEVITDGGLTAYEIDVTFTSSTHEDYEVEEGDQYFGIVYVDGDLLYFSEDSNGSGSSASNRSTTLGFHTPFYRQ